MIHPFIIAAGLALMAATAHADPCEAPVKGFKAGDTFRGLVWVSIDGDGLCVGPTPDPRTWIEVRESRFFAPELHDQGGREAKRVIDRLVGKRAVCTVERGQNGRSISYDRVIATCRVDGRSIAEWHRSAGTVEGGKGYGR